jgi:Reverse transcriptase (RNA-dependent DNA polymerase)
MTRFAGTTSNVADINASVIQGSGFGPSAFTVNASDLHPVNYHNKMTKFADDTYLIVPSSKRHTICEELDSISTWASINNLKLNPSKSREMMITRRPKSTPLPPSMAGMKRVDSMVILGVTINSTLRASLHVEKVLNTCTSSLHALRLLRLHGLSPEVLQRVVKATTLSRLLYAAPAWYGLTTAGERKSLERFQTKMQRMSYLPNDSESIGSLIVAAETRLFRSVINNDTHVLRPFFPPIIKRQYNMRPRTHNFTLPNKDDSCFIPRLLYRF